MSASNAPAGGAGAGNPPASTPSSNAVSCNKGYLWPFLREPGDCLTATEKQTNKTGVYRGGGGRAGEREQCARRQRRSRQSACTTLPAGNASVSCNKGYLWPFLREPGDCLTATERQTNKTGVYRGGEVAQVSASNAPAGGAGAGNPPASTPSSNAVSCNKGYLWPFLREPGDCLTATEKQTNKTGVYRGGEVAQVSASNAPAGNAGAGNPPANTPSSNAVSCNKGYLWPFLREPGDCLTATERQTNKTGVYRGGEVAQVSASNAPAGGAGAGNPPANTPSSNAVSCNKGYLWPFLREPGDCLTAAEKQTNKTGAYRGGEATQVEREQCARRRCRSRHSACQHSQQQCGFVQQGLPVAFPARTGRLPHRRGEAE